MKFYNKDINTLTIDDKFSSVAKAIKAEPYTLIYCRQEKGGPIDAIMLSPELFELLKEKAEACDILTESPGFGTLRAEMRRLQALVKPMADTLGKIGMTVGERTSLWMKINKGIFGDENEAN